MDTSLLDSPAVLAALFHPQSAPMGRSRLPNVTDGHIPITADVALGYRLYRHEAGAPVIMYWHGNGEIAPVYDYFAGEFHRAGASLIVVDYRGYGWSTGTPRFSTLLSDAEMAADALPAILHVAGLDDSPCYLMGRSLGSAPSIHLAHWRPEQFKGLIIESGFSLVLPLLARLGLMPPAMDTPDPMGNLDKMRDIRTPLLVIHGENDQLIPVSNGQALYDASPAENKRILRVRHAGHNDLLMVEPDAYFDAIRVFLQGV